MSTVLLRQQIDAAGPFSPLCRSIEKLDGNLVRYGLLVLGDNGDGPSSTGGKRRRKHISHPSSSDSSAAAEDSGHGEKDLFGPEVVLSEEDQANYAQLLFPNITPRINPNVCMSSEEYFKVEERLARFRVAYYKKVQLEFKCELKKPEEYSEDELRKESYFKYLEDDECFEWYFHPHDSQNPELNDYQRIVLRNYVPDTIEPQYLVRDDYRSRYHTYKIDDVYVKYYGEISKKIKWIQDYLHLDRRDETWREKDTRAWRQALRIATQFPHMTVRLAGFAYDEYIFELRTDASLKDKDILYFEIWRLVAKDNKSHMEAVEEVYTTDKFHIHKRLMDAELNGTAVWTMKQTIDCIVREGGINSNTADDEARDLFRKILFRMHKPKNMAKYAEKKMEIADRLNLDKEA